MAKKSRKMEAEAVERRRVWADIYSNVQAAGRLLNSDPDSSGFNAFIQAMRNYLARYIRAMDEERPVVWFNLGWNPEFLYAMDIPGVCVQQMAVFHNIAQNNEKCNELIDLAEAHGVNFAATTSGKIKMFLQSFAIGTVVIKMAHVPEAQWGHWFTSATFIVMLVVTTVSGIRATKRPH